METHTTVIRCHTKFDWLVTNTEPIKFHVRLILQRHYEKDIFHIAIGAVLSKYNTHVVIRTMLANIDDVIFQANFICLVNSWVNACIHPLD